MCKYSEILKALCNCKEDDNINYAPYSSGNIVQSISFKNALKMFEKDVEEMKIFLGEYGIKKKPLKPLVKFGKNIL